MGQEIARSCRRRWRGLAAVLVGAIACAAVVAEPGAAQTTLTGGLVTSVHPGRSYFTFTSPTRSTITVYTTDATLYYEGMSYADAKLWPELHGMPNGVKLLRVVGDFDGTRTVTNASAVYVYVPRHSGPPALWMATYGAVQHMNAKDPDIVSQTFAQPNGFILTTSPASQSNVNAINTTYNGATTVLSGGLHTVSDLEAAISKGLAQGATYAFYDDEWWANPSTPSVDELSPIGYSSTFSGKAAGEAGLKTFFTSGDDISGPWNSAWSLSPGARDWVAQHEGQSGVESSWPTYAGVDTNACDQDSASDGRFDDFLSMNIWGGVAPYVDGIDMQHQGAEEQTAEFGCEMKAGWAQIRQAKAIPALAELSTCPSCSDRSGPVATAALEHAYNATKDYVSGYFLSVSVDASQTMSSTTVISVGSQRAVDFLNWAKSCSDPAVNAIAVSPTSLRLTNAGTGSTPATIAVSAATPGSSSVGCGWAATDDMDWIHEVDAARGEGDGSFAVTVDPNKTGSTRIGHITVESKTLTVTQDP